MQSCLRDHALAISIELQLVTDGRRRTDIHRAIAYTALAYRFNLRGETSLTLICAVTLSCLLQNIIVSK